MRYPRRKRVRFVPLTRRLWIGTELPVTGFPEIKLQVAFSTGPLAAVPAFTEVTSYWKAGEFRSPARSFELDQIEPGGGSLTLDNADRTFEPEYASSGFYPNVVPVRKARLRIRKGSTTYYPWTGYVETWPPNWDRPNDSEVDVLLLDAMEALNSLELVASYSQETTGTRIGNVLDSIGFPTSDRDIDTGQTTVIAKTFVATDEVTALQHIREVVNTEGPTAAFFIDGQGRAIFHDRHRRLKTPYTTSQATFGDADGEIPYERIRPNFSKDLIFNIIRVTREGGTTQTASDSTSQDAYMKRSRAFSTLHTSDVEPADLAQFALSRYKDPALRFDEIEIAPLEDDTIWETLLGLTLGERVTVKRRPPEHPTGSGTVVSKDCHIEGITWSFPRGEVRDARVRFLLTPADSYTYWTLGDANLSLLGSSTRLAY